MLSQAKNYLQKRRKLTAGLVVLVSLFSFVGIAYAANLYDKALKCEQNNPYGYGFQYCKGKVIYNCALDKEKKQNISYSKARKICEEKFNNDKWSTWVEFSRSYSPLENIYDYNLSTDSDSENDSSGDNNQDQKDDIFDRNYR